MLAFVTGSTGLLGNNLVRALLHQGHRVRALARSKEKARRELGDTEAQVVLGDMSDIAGFADALDGVDVVFHTATYFREYFAPGDHAEIIDRINVQATVELARVAQARRVKKMIQTSSAGIIGLMADGSPGHEESSPWPGVKRNLYLQSKRTVEPLLNAFSRETGFFIAFALPAWMWGPHDSAPTPSGQLVFDSLKHKLPPAVPPGGMSVVDARDVATGMLQMVQGGRSGERYILSGGYAEFGEIIANLALLTGARRPTVKMPFAGALAVAAIAETWHWVTGKASPMSVEGVRLLHARLKATSAKAERELSVSFRPFSSSLADTVEWARARFQKVGDPQVAVPSGSGD